MKYLEYNASTDDFAASDMDLHYRFPTLFELVMNRTVYSVELAILADHTVHITFVLSPSNVETFKSIKQRFVKCLKERFGGKKLTDDVCQELTDYCDELYRSVFKANLDSRPGPAEEVFRDFLSRTAADIKRKQAKGD